MSQTTVEQNSAITSAAPAAWVGRRDIANRVIPAFEEFRRVAANGGGTSIDVAEAIRLIRLLNLMECKGAWHILRDFQGSERMALLDALATRWASLDSRDALAEAMRNRSDHAWRHRLGSTAAAVLVQSDPEGALKIIEEARGTEPRMKAAEWILPQVAKVNPLRAIAYLEADKLVGRSDDILRAVAREYAVASPRDAVEWADSIKSARERQDAVGAAFRAWADNSPAEAAAALVGSPKYALNARLFESVAHAWSRSDPAAALAWAQSLTDQGSREQAMRSLDLDPQKIGPEATKSLVESITSESTRAEYARRVAERMASNGSIDEAIAWAESLSSENDRARALQSVIQQWAGHDPAEAARYATKLPQSREREDVIKEALSHWVRVDPDEAFAFGQGLPEGRDRDTAMERAVESMRDQDPKKALEWYKTIGDPEIAQKAAESLLGSLVRVDQGAALQLAAQMPPEAQPKTYHTMVRGWAFDQPQEAGNWVNSLPSGEARDAAVKAYVSVIDGMDAGAATQWAYTMQEPTERMETTLNVFERWLQNDRAAAGNWVQQTDLPEGFRPFFERLLNDQKYAERPR